MLLYPDMNKLVEATFKIYETGNMVKIYRYNENKTGVYLSPNKPRIYDVDIEYFVDEFKRIKGYELIETRRQVKERVLGNFDEAYQTIKYI